MTQPFTEAIRAIPGQPSSVRVGRIESANPLVLNVQGALFSSSAVGVLGSYVPQVGETVSVLGQSVISGSDPQSWLILGSNRPASTTAGLVVSSISMASCDAALSLTSVIQTVSGTTINVTTTRNNAVAVVNWVADINAAGATITTGVVRLNVDGVASTHQALYAMSVAAAAGRSTIGQNDMVTLTTAGAHTFHLSGQRVGGADNQLVVNAIHTTILVTIYE